MDAMLLLTMSMLTVSTLDTHHLDETQAGGMVRMKTEGGGWGVGVGGGGWGVGGGVDRAWSH